MIPNILGIIAQKLAGRAVFSDKKGLPFFCFSNIFKNNFQKGVGIMCAEIRKECNCGKNHVGCPSNKMDTELGDIEFIGGNEDGKREATVVS